MTDAAAFAKINLSLGVRPRDSSGLHPLRSLAQSISPADRISLDEAPEDAFEVFGEREGLGEPSTNLAWQALEASRPARSRHAFRLHKLIPVAAGLGGGSADAAAVLALVQHLYGPSDDIDRLAPTLGSDVPFCLVGGTAWIEGRGDRIERLPLLADLHIALVVPPFSLSTAAVYARWDALDGPTGPALEPRHLPMALRAEAPLPNDLTPAAIDIEPGLGDWIADLNRLWGQGVAMSGSGPALYSLFATESEAAGAAAAVRGARLATAVGAAARGWEFDPGGTLPAPPWGVV